MLKHKKKTRKWAIRKRTFLPKGMNDMQIACGKSLTEEKVIIVYKANNSFTTILYKRGKETCRMLISDKGDRIASILWDMYETIGRYKKIRVRECRKWFESYSKEFPFNAIKSYNVYIYIPKEVQK